MKFFFVKNFFILLLLVNIRLFEYIPKITSEPTNLVISRISSFFILINFLIIKNFKMLAAFIDPPPNPASVGIFFFIIIRNLIFFKIFFLSKTLNNLLIVFFFNFFTKFSVKYYFMTILFYPFNFN